MPHHDSPTPAQRAVTNGNQRPRLIIIATVLASAVVTIDNTVLNVALPSIADHLAASTGQLQWIVNAYSLLFGGLLITAGSVADRLGHRRVLLAGLAVFAVASTLVVLVRNADSLIVLRAVLGAAAAFVMPSTLAILYRSFTGPARAAAVGAWSAVSAAGFAAGPILGGLILISFPWQGVFLINVPIAAAALLAARCWLPATRPGARARLDLPGTLLSVAMMLALVGTLISGPSSGWTSGQVLGTAVGTLVLGALLAAWELHCPAPMLDVRMLARRAFAGPALAEGTLMFAIAGALFLLTQHLQLALGHSPLLAGVMVAPAALGIMAATPVASRLSTRLDAARTASVGIGIVALALVIIAAGLPHGYPPIGIGLVIFGVGVRLSLTPVALAVIDALPRDRAGVGSALNDTFQEIGGSLGVAVLGSACAVIYRDHLGRAVPAGARSSLSAAVQLHQPTVASAARAAFESGMQGAMWLAAAIAALMAVVARLTLPRTVLAEPDGDGANQDGANQDGANQDGANQDGANQDGANQDGANQDGANQDGANQGDARGAAAAGPKARGQRAGAR